MVTFLDLPQEVRSSIYELSGLTRQCPIDLSERGNVPVQLLPYGYGPARDECWYKQRLRGSTSSITADEKLCVCPRLQLELTLVSRQVRSESLDFLLGTNLFVVRARDLASEPFSDYHILRNVPIAHLARMRRLVVRLNCWPCPWGHDPTSYYNPKWRRTPAPSHCRFCDTAFARDHAALSVSSPTDLRLLKGWEDLCRRLGSGRKPGQSSLTVICDVESSDDGQTASLVTGPLIKYLPLLRSCTIRLGRSASYRTARMARDAALSMMGCKAELPPATKAFPFGKLPRELKLAVLRYTHLGPPELAGYDDDFGQVEIINGSLLHGMSIDANFQFVRGCCSTCTETQLDWSASPLPHYFSLTPRVLTVASCCNNRYASFSPTCKCRVLPLSLFLVDRDTRLVAIEAFYSTTRFILRHDDLDSILDFLPSDALPYLRNVTIAFTPEHCYVWTGSIACTDLPLPDWLLDQITDAHFPHHRNLKLALVDSHPDPPNHRENFKSILSTLASCGSAPLKLELDLRSAYVFAERCMWDAKEEEDEWFR